MFTDIVGYTALAQRNESAALKLLSEQRKILRGMFPRHGGKEIKTISDAFLVEFSSALEALRCAVAIQSAIRQRNASTSTEPIQIRIGIHAGDVISSENDIHGDAVNVASRLEPLAEPGGICFSEEVYHHVRNKLECPVESLGRIELKNVELPMEVYKIVVTPWEKEAPTQPQSKISTAALLDRHRIAILPMSNLSGESDEYFSDGMTEELISTICTISGLRVTSRTSAMKYKDTAKSIPEIGRELNVGTILEGSARKAGNRLRVAVQLIDVKTDEHLWSEVYERSLEDVFAIQSDIAKRVSEALRVNLLAQEKEIIEKKPTRNTDAYNLYLKGRYHWHRGTEEELKKGIQDFEDALEIDPDFALAYVGLADCYIALCQEGCLDTKEAHSRIEPLVKKALVLDDKLPEAHATMALLLQEYDWNWEGAEKRYRRALELNPNWSDVCHSYAVHLALRGRFEQAITEIKRAEELDPYSIGIHTCAAETYRVSSDHESAISECIRMLEIDPNFAPAYTSLGRTYLQKAMFEEGLQALEKAFELSHGGLTAKSYLAFAYGIMGRKEDARKLIFELEETAKRQYVSPFNIAIAHAGLKDIDLTLEWLLKAYEQHVMTIVKVKVEPAFDFLRSDPRFIDLQKEIGLS